MFTLRHLYCGTLRPVAWERSPKIEPQVPPFSVDRHSSDEVEEIQEYKTKKGQLPVIGRLPFDLYEKTFLGVGSGYSVHLAVILFPDRCVDAL